jgi:signal transduction histidine kinase
MPERDSLTDKQSDDVFRWAGSLRDDYADVEWAATPLGPIVGWPQSLRTALSICLASALPSVIAWGPDLTLLYNEAFVPILGDKHPEALGASHPQVFWESSNKTGAAIAEVIATGVGTVYADVMLPLRRHGFTEDCYFNYGRSPLADESSAIVGVFSVVVETTERVVAERGLREQTERLGLLQRLTQHLAATMTDAEIARVVLSEARPLLGASAGGVMKVADGWAERISDSPLPEGTDRFQRTPLDARVPTCEAIRRAAPVVLHMAAERETAYDSEWVEAFSEYGLVVAMPMLVDGNAVGALALAFLSDRTLTDDEIALLQTLADQCGQALQRARLLAAERAHVREIEAANAELASFSYCVSHDLRAPLRALNGLAEVLLEDYCDHIDEIGLGHLGRIRDASQKMSALIEDLLQLARLASMEPERLPVDLSAVAQDVAEQLQAANPARHVKFRIAPGIVGSADPNLIRAVFDNLIGNAWKYTTHQADAVIEFDSTAIPGDPVIYFVADNGAGFDPAYADKLFQPFRRLHGSEFPGTGIGLVSVMRTIERHGGRIWAAGAVDRGATFSFTLDAKEMP